MAVKLSAICAGLSLLLEYLVIWYSFLLETESTAGTSAAGRIRYIETIQLPHLEFKVLVVVMPIFITAVAPVYISVQKTTQPLCLQICFNFNLTDDLFFSVFSNQNLFSPTHC
jgi:hypothetical protein